MRVAVIQLCSGMDKKTNILKALSLLEEAVAKKARFILLPEFFGCRLPMGQSAGPLAEEIPGPTMARFMDLARQKKVFILAGTIYEKTNQPGKAYNTATLIGDNGQVLVKYRKRNLFVASVRGKGIDETKHFLPGKKPATAVIENFNVGLTICYDLRFPGIFTDYARRGCDVMIAPASFSRSTGIAHWEVLLRARAIETLSYVLAPNQFGACPGGTPAYGHSLIISPWGEILAQAPAEGDAVIVADLDKKAIKQARAILPDVIKKGKRS